MSDADTEQHREDKRSLLSEQSQEKKEDNNAPPFASTNKSSTAQPVTAVSGDQATAQLTNDSSEGKNDISLSSTICVCVNMYARGRRRLYFLLRTAIKQNLTLAH